MRHRLSALPFALLLAASPLGCDDAGPADAPAGASTEQGRSPEAIVRAIEPRVPAYVEAELELLRGRAHQLITARLDAHRNPLGLHHVDLLGPLYEARDAAPVFLQDGGLSGNGALVMEILDEGQAHGLDPQELHRDDARQRAEALNQAPLFDPAFYALTPEEREALQRHVETSPPGDELDAWLGALLRDEDGPLNRLASARRDELQRAKKLLKQAAELELLLADGLLHYADAFHNPHDVGEERRRALGDARLARHHKVAAFQAAEAGAPLAEHLQGLIPKHRQYQRLKRALRFYRDIQAEGGWPEIEVKSYKLPIKRGHRDDYVAQLERRLAAEGYYHDPVSGEFGSKLEEAVEAYQRTHQLDDDGRVDEDTLWSLNIPLETRIAQIEVSMERWRAIRIGQDPYYIFVNIPDFHGEVWRDGERLRRFRVVVGNTSRFYDKEREQYIFPRETPQMSKTVRSVIFNPYWYPPPSVVHGEFPEKLAEDPDFYEKNGFEILDNGKIRQNPGPLNALGQVKLMFPNDDSIYMHDTPDKHLFRQEVRAFSHGCIRVHEPLELARLILEQDGRDDVQEQIDAFLATGEEHTIGLDTRIPVHIDYITVRVDDEGRAHFNADPYRRDKPRLEARLARNEAAAKHADAGSP